MKKALIISTKEAWAVDLSELTSVNALTNSGRVILSRTGNEEMGYIQVSSDQEAKWFVTRLFANMDNSLNLLIDYTTGSCISASNLNTVNDVLNELESETLTQSTLINPERLANIRTAIQSLNVKDE